MHRLLPIILLFLPPASLCDDFVTDASVIRSEPITKTTNLMSPGCRAGRPATESFTKLLEWDVGCELSREVKITSYRVLYRFQGETFAMVTEEQPGDTIPIKITLN